MKTYTKDELYNLLKNGAILDELLDMSDGQECTIFKADCFPEEDCYNSVIYIPDLDMNGVAYDHKMTLQELADAYTNFTLHRILLISVKVMKKRQNECFTIVIGSIHPPNLQRWKHLTKMIAMLDIIMLKLVGASMTLLIQRKERVLY